MTRAVLLLALAATLLAAPAAAARPGDFGLQRVARSTQPVYLTAPRGDARLFVVDRLGQVFVVKRGRRLRRPFADLRPVVQLENPRDDAADQGGLLSLAFAPDYRTSGLLYVFYTHRDGDIHVDELRVSARNPDVVLGSSRRTLLTVERLTRNDIGGHLAFGPDRLLYAGFGYGADPEESQDLSSLRGKLLRIDPRAQPAAPYAVPPDNPFIATPGVRPEVYASGLRVPWRFSFDRSTGDLVLPDVGESRFEEANFVPRGTGAGANFGWPLFEGRARRRSGDPDGLVFPALTRRHGPATCAIIGGPVVRDRRLRSLYRRFVYANLCDGELRSTVLTATRARGDRREGSVEYPVSFGEDGRGRVYVVSLGGSVFRVVPRSR